MLVNMTIEEIKEAILALPDSEIEPLYKWLGDYYDGEVWDRQMAADIQRMGADAWAAALAAGMEGAHKEKHRAALRLMNNMQFKRAADRDKCIKDFELIVGEALEK